MKLVVFTALVAFAAAAKLPGESPQPPTAVVEAAHLQAPQPPIAILRDDRLAPHGAVYKTDFETENGIVVSESGQAGSGGQSNAEGFISYTSPEGQQVHISYIANEFGFQPQGDQIPTPHPLPAHAIAQIAFAEEQARLRAQSEN
ncbi:LOW QUALITY PROTEIN: cuticle protein AM1199 [Procambarus clarkii]|uniref:LOW QUALITY PROTEIN: cuticle protein AM1199 n=1 Tax=Procambarus clarkii TaxID=6728 RepID=UPI0037429BA7